MTIMLCGAVICEMMGCQGHCTPAPSRMGAAMTAKGCICPPGSEKTCERTDCGRKDLAPPPKDLNNG